MGDFLTTVSTNLGTEVTGALTSAAPIVAIIAGIAIGWKIYQKVTGSRS